MTHELQRLTTEYVAAEDRIRLIAEIGEAQTVMLWLTQRLLNHLVAHLCRWLEQHATLGDAAIAMPAHHRELAQGFAQQAARQQQVPELPVRTNSLAATWRVDSIDVASGASAVGLTLLGEAGEVAHFSMAPLSLRQWLGIIFEQYCTAGWPLAVWPSWMTQSTSTTAPVGALSLH